LDTHSADLFIPNFFLSSGLDAWAAPKPLIDVASPAEGRVRFGRATMMVTNELKPAVVVIALARLQQNLTTGPL
jgi:hypothetical protein